jgi:hypothetical protein
MASKLRAALNREVQMMMMEVWPQVVEAKNRQEDEDRNTETVARYHGRELDLPSLRADMNPRKLRRGYMLELVPANLPEELSQRKRRVVQVVHPE